jgi:hypothetical protein
MVSTRQNLLAAWTTFSLIGLLVPFLAMLAFDAPHLTDRVKGMVSYATICLPGIVFVVSVIGEQVESGRGLDRPREYILLFVCGVILFIFVGISATGIFERKEWLDCHTGIFWFFLSLQLVATIITVLASAVIKSSLTRR